MRFEDEQKTFEWYRARWGHVTSTSVRPLIVGKPEQINKILDRLEMQWNATDDQIELAFLEEQDLGSKIKALAWGTLYEKRAITEFETEYGIPCRRPTFIPHPEWPELLGSSIDFEEINEHTGEILRPGEAKAPLKLENHIAYRNVRKHLTYHKHQMQLHMAVLGSQDCRFVSFHPDADPEKQVYADLVPRDEEWQDTLRMRMKLLTKYHYAGKRLPVIEEG
jgi:hypothetical protein